MKPEEALNTIRGIELTHMEVHEDENIDGEWEYWDDEESDGTIEENHPEEVKALEGALEVLRILSKHVKKIPLYPGHEKEPGIQITVSSEAEEEYASIKNWLGENK